MQHFIIKILAEEHYFFMVVAKMLEQILEEYSYNLLLCDFSHDPRKLQEKLEFVKDRFGDGLILFDSVRKIKEGE
jgi:DNA-binding LacI/PurR family transcriptional regulator